MPTNSVIDQNLSLFNSVSSPLNMQMNSNVRTTKAIRPMSAAHPR